MRDKIDEIIESIKRQGSFERAIIEVDARRRGEIDARQKCRAQQRESMNQSVREES